MKIKTITYHSTASKGVVTKEIVVSDDNKSFKFNNMACKWWLDFEKVKIPYEIGEVN